MDWLDKYKTIIDWRRSSLPSLTPEGEKKEYRGSNFQKAAPIISATRAFKMLKKGCQGFMYCGSIG